MKQIGNGKCIPLSNGTTAVVRSLLGEGGQGAVYRCEVNGKQYALKIYARRPSQAFMNNLAENIRQGAPTEHFLWPLACVNTRDYTGYLMPLRPKDYVDFSRFLVAKARFASWSAMLNGALQITLAFRELHRRGLSYQDLNDGNFFFNPATGDVRICDNDNVCPADVNLGIKGKCRYMAPEVVVGKSQPNNLSDYFSLSVVLFMLLTNNHPLDGKRVASVPCLTDEVERHVYGEHPIFIFDPKDESNRPVSGVHTNVIIRWPLFPQFVRDAFTHAFSQEVLHTPNRRWSDNDWLNMLLTLRNRIVVCSCGNETFYDIDKPVAVCFNCNSTLPRVLLLKTEKQYVPLFLVGRIFGKTGKKEEFGRDRKGPGCDRNGGNFGREEVDFGRKGENFCGRGENFGAIGSVVANKNNPALWGIRNETEQTWVCTLPDQRTLSVPPKGAVPIFRGVKINFGDHEGTIIGNNER